MHILRMTVEKSNEWGEELWLAALDAEKAFDRVHHTDLFDALLVAGVDATSLRALRELYSNMEAYVCLWSGAESRMINVKRGVRQGDPLPQYFSTLCWPRCSKR